MQRNSIPLALCALIVGLGAWVSPLRADGIGVIVITEINYHPHGGGRDLEFIELYNATPGPVDLSGWYFADGVAFTFPDGTILDGRRSLVVAANLAKLEEQYGDISNAIGDWGFGCDTDDGSGCGLSNGGEGITLAESNGVTHCRVRYNDRGKWPASADGLGHSLELSSPYAEQDDPDEWFTSVEMGGSPGDQTSPAETAEEKALVKINEALLQTDGDRWIELYNDSDSEVDLSGYHVTNDRAALEKATIADGTTIAPRAFLVLTEADLGLDLAPVAEAGAPAGAQLRTLVALLSPEADFVVDAYIFEPEADDKSEARFPDGDEDFVDQAVPTPGEANAVDVESNVVINEVMYHPIDNDDRREWIEIFNRGDEAVDLSGWRFSSGINYNFNDGQMIGAKQYLVIAKYPEHIREVYGLSDAQVIGPAADDEAALDRFGQLRNDGERINLQDPAANIADTVRYHDGGQWPSWPDGRGSSMELRDPWQNNNVPGAWDSSDDSDKAETVDLSYIGRGVPSDSEIRMILLGAGITRIDNFRMFQRETNFHEAGVILEEDEVWTYFRGRSEASEPRDAWTKPGFDDSGWESGASGIGFGEDDKSIRTVIDDMRDNYTSVFMRKVFRIDDLSAIGPSPVLDMLFDDGYIAYLNGVRIEGEDLVYGNMRAGQDTFDATAARSRERAREQVDLTRFRDLLVEGDNVLAIQGHNNTIGGSDFVIRPRLIHGEYIDEDGPNLIENGDFEDAAFAPRANQPGFMYIQGNHIHSGPTTIDPLDGRRSFKIVSTGRGDNKVNRVEISLPRLANNPYVISLKVRWVVGAQSMLVQGYDQKFPKSLSIPYPDKLGTPGEPNSVLEENTGPVIDKVSLSNVIPRANEDVTVSARVSDPDGVASVKLYYSINTRRAAEDAEMIEMQGPNADGRYTAVIPGQSSRARVVYQVVAEDTEGGFGRYPNDQIQRTHPLVLDPTNPEPIDTSFLVYRHDNPQSALQLGYRFWMDSLNENYLRRRQIQSNDKVEGTLIFNNEFIYNGAHTRRAGSPFARGGQNSWRIYAPKDRPLHGALKKWNHESHQGASGEDARERISHYLIRHNQGNETAAYTYGWLSQLQVNDITNDVLEHQAAPNRDFLQRWWKNDDDGAFFEVDDRHVFNDGGSRASSLDARLTYPPYANQATQLGLSRDNKELYRWHFNLRQNEAVDDFSELVNFAQLMTASQVSDEEFDRRVWDEVNVEAFLRVWSIRLNTDDWDTWGARRGKNCYLYHPTNDSRWVLLPWDMELTYGNAGAFMPPQITGRYNSSFAEVTRMINRPRIKRMYYGIMADMVDNQFNSDFLTPFMAKLQARRLQRTEIGRRGGFIDQRANSLRNILRSSRFPAVGVEIGTNDGEDMTVDVPSIQLEGRAPVDVAQIVVTLNGGEPVSGAVESQFSNSDVFGWGTTPIALGAGVNTIEVFGFSSSGDLVDSDEIAITYVEGDAPTIASIDPAQAAVGEWVVIDGTGYHGNSQVWFGDVEASEVDRSAVPTQLTVRVPEGLDNGPVQVTVGLTDGPTSAPSELEIVTSLVPFVRGDVDFSGNLSISDSVKILGHLFSGRPVNCEDAADVDDNGVINLTDAVNGLNYLFLNGSAPAAPFPSAGTDVTEDELGCEGGPSV